MSGDLVCTASILSGLMYSPCASLKIAFLRSKIRSRPPSMNIPTSPVCSHPVSSMVSLVAASFFKYPEKRIGPRTQISPRGYGLSIFE
jgi:hypothetical protein